MHLQSVPQAVGSPAARLHVLLVKGPGVSCVPHYYGHCHCQHGMPSPPSPPHVTDSWREDSCELNNNNNKQRPGNMSGSEGSRQTASRRDAGAQPWRRGAVAVLVCDPAVPGRSTPGGAGSDSFWWWSTTGEGGHIQDSAVRVWEHAGAEHVQRWALRPGASSSK